MAKRVRRPPWRDPAWGSRRGRRVQRAIQELEARLAHAAVGRDPGPPPALERPYRLRLLVQRLRPTARIVWRRLWRPSRW